MQGQFTMLKLHWLIVALSYLGFVSGTKENCTWDDITPSKTLRWCPCFNGVYCAKLDVPLDYQKPSAGRAAVALLKYPADPSSQDGPYQGMILLNPGGPGASGVDEAQTLGANLSRNFGTNWDFVGFDTRGMFETRPLLNCSAPFKSSSNTRSLSRRKVPRLSSDDDFYHDYIDWGQRLGKNCQDTQGAEDQAGPHMSTAIFARDMASITDAFAATKDGKRAKKGCLTNYYGTSYGSVLGQTYASMFPHKVGNFVIDGVASPGAYLRDFAIGFINHLDGVLGTYFIYCFEAGSSKCPFSKGSSSPKALYDRFKSSFVQLDGQKAADEGWKNATEIGVALLALKIGLLNAAYSPISTFGNISEALLSLESSVKAQNPQLLIDTLNRTLPDTSESLFALGQYLYGALCSDQGNRWYGKTLADFQPIIKKLEKESILGEAWIRGELPCSGWSVKASEVFNGPFGGDTATPMVFVSNTYDPVTPIEASRQYAPKFKGAQVLTIDGTGHMSSATHNKCVSTKLKAYFQETQLPGKNSFCPLEKGPFGIQLRGTLESNLENAGLSSLRS